MEKQPHVCLSINLRELNETLYNRRVILSTVLNQIQPQQRWHKVNNLAASFSMYCDWELYISC